MEAVLPPRPNESAVVVSKVVAIYFLKVLQLALSKRGLNVRGLNVQDIAVFWSPLEHFIFRRRRDANSGVKGKGSRQVYR